MPIVPFQGHLQSKPGRTLLVTMQARGFGLSDREMARLAQMKRPDEPLDEEVRGLSVLGATGGFLVGPILFGSSLLGLVIGVQLGPVLAFMEGPRGDRVRAAGWEAWRIWRIQVKRAGKAWLAVEREAEARGVTRVLRQGWARLLEWDEQTGVSRRCVGCAQVAWSIMLLAWARLRASRVAHAAGALWQRTTVPRRWNDFKQRAILQARMAHLRRTEAEGPQGDRGPRYS